MARNTSNNDVVFTTEGSISTKGKLLNDYSLEVSDDSLPESYYTNSNKEELCLEYVSNFQKQFRALFPDRSSLYLSPCNERNIPKLVCTTLRPTLLPYRELYDATKCADFVSSIMDYEPIEDSLAPPKCLPSPSLVLKWQTGDCFDIANLLTSFLIGAGYDAYVVYGCAEKWICVMDQRKTICPYLDVTERIFDESETNQEEDTDNEKFKSKFLISQEKKEKDRRKKEISLENIDFDDEDDEVDPLEGQRVHAWVLVRAGKRDVTEHFFIESSTGRQYKVSDCPYTKIDSLWNNQNYFVNMQQHQTVAHTLFDLNDATDWEYVFIPPNTTKDYNDDSSDSKLGLTDVVDPIQSQDSGNNLDEANQELDEENILDLPPSWVGKLIVEREVFKKRYFNDGRRVILYKKAKLEQYADNRHSQGLVTRLTIFRDIARNIPIECREFFKNRKDKLDYRIRYVLEGKIVEHFLPGRIPEALKYRIELLGKRRELHFYTSARLDGLVRREEIVLKKSMEYFEGREDRLIYRSVVFAEDKDHGTGKALYTLPGGLLGEFVVEKMTEKFERDHSKDADEDPHKRTYNIQDALIRVQFHYAPKKITASSRIYHKSSNTPFEVIQVDPYAKRPKESILEEEFNIMLAFEKECYNAIRHAELESQEVIKIRKREEFSISLETSIFDRARDNAKDDNFEEHNADEEKEMGVRHVDYLTPFLQSYNSNGKISREEAQKARDNCLKALKERLLERANIIQARLDEENALLAKKQAAFQRSQREHDQGTDEEFEKFCSEAMFRIQILEQRLTRHEESALQKYADMDNKLHSDPRLSVLHN